MSTTTKHFTNSHVWRVEFTIRERYTLNKSITVICGSIQEAIEQALIKYPEATIIKAFRGERWGSEGLVIVWENNEPASA